MLLDRKLEPKTRMLCFSGFAAVHSGLTRTPLWPAERLTRAGQKRADVVARVDDFHAEARLPADERAELQDYARSGFDRGHLAPAADMSSKSAQRQSSSLANIIPQAPESNRGIWSDIEGAVRDLARRDGEVFVVTGVVFAGETLQRVGGRVFVPTQVWKAVYVPRSGLAGAYVVENTASQDWREIPITELAALAGIDPFPALQGTSRSRQQDLPDPRSPRQQRQDTKQPSGSGSVLEQFLEQLTR
ncbi:DNA/RNA non-specific endonuclease [Arenibaculum pallidiluteum]|uniref:DNA/RNA non-specific endonuclease n=1 Tax=Arenibaculum pallidiluteum TaxID=2812559 RepID=UPI002E2CC560|nr:DNA/RNA non-specific endonuclease [Arenibaculum pallidiluteum]